MIYWLNWLTPFSSVWGEPANKSKQFDKNKRTKLILYISGQIFTCSIITQLPTSILLRLKRSAWFGKLPVPTPCLPCRMKSKRRWKTLTPNNRWSSLARDGLSFYVTNLYLQFIINHRFGVPCWSALWFLIMLVNLRNFTLKAPQEIDTVPGDIGTIGVGFSPQSQTGAFMSHDFPCLNF